MKKEFSKNFWPWVVTSSIDTSELIQKPLPKISIITPSFNQGKYLEETILSVINQQYPNYELIIIDAGSTDNTLDIIHKYDPFIHYWVSEKDRGQSHAILKGLQVVTGDIVNWINSDDMCAPGSFHAIAKQFDFDKFDVLCGRCNFIDDTIDKIVLRDERMGISENVGLTLLKRNINQPSAFFRSHIMKNLSVDEQFHYAMDLDMWFRYIITVGQKRVKLTDDLLTYFRLHGASKSVAEADKFQNDINKVYYNILLGANQPDCILKFVEYNIDEFDKFIPKPYSISISYNELYAFFSSFAYRASEYYYLKGAYDSARKSLEVGKEFDFDKAYLNMDFSLRKRLKFPNYLIHFLRYVKNIIK